VEEGWLDDEITERIIDRYLSPMKNRGIDTLILGCTHYPLLQPSIQKFMGSGVSIIDAPSAVLDSLGCSPFAEDGGQQYAFTDENPRTRELIEVWLGRTVQAKTVQLPQ
jgi:glutamate racemase